MTAGSVTSPPEPPEVEDGFDEGDDGNWWSRSPRWAQAVVAGGAVLALLLVGGLGGLLLGQRSAETYGPAPGSIDVAFLQDMTVHHQQAVLMATWERSNTADPALRQLSYDMESSQTAQVGMMQGWLRLWGEPVDNASGTYMGWMGMPSTSMPGMASDADLDRLRSSSGVPLDVEFLQLMLRHHQGGLDMARIAASDASVPAVQQLARSMLTTQSSEVDTMVQMLAERGAAPLPAPTMAMGN